MYYSYCPICALIDPDYRSYFNFLEPYFEDPPDLVSKSKISNYLSRILISREIEFEDAYCFENFFEDMYNRHDVWEINSKEYYGKESFEIDYDDDGEYIDELLEIQFDEYCEIKRKEYFSSINIILIENSIQFYFAMNFLEDHSKSLVLKTANYNIVTEDLDLFNERIDVTDGLYVNRFKSLFFYDSSLVEKLQESIKKEIKIFDEEWEKIDDSDKIVDLLIAAHFINIWARKIPKLYEWKNLLLEKIIKLSLKKKYPYYKWGFKMQRFSDWSKYPVILYFEIEDWVQFTFHTNYVDYCIPKFEGEWKGKLENDDFILSELPYLGCFEEDQYFKEEELLNVYSHLFFAESLIDDYDTVLMHEKKYDLLDNPYDYDDPIEDDEDEEDYQESIDFLELNWDREWTM